MTKFSSGIFSLKDHSVSVNDVYSHYIIIHVTII